MKQSFVIAVLASTALLAACGNDAAPQGEENAAGGEVLEASLSDAMIPLESVQTQAKLAPAIASSDSGNSSSSVTSSNPAGGDGVGSASGQAGAETGNASSSDVAPAPATPASPSPSPAQP